MARGRKKQLPAAVEQIIETINLKDSKEQLKEEVRLIIGELPTKEAVWDVSLEDKITFFDPTLSYEISGYRPVDEERGLDFDPEWFMQARRIKEQTGKYCAYPPGQKKYNDFWREEHRRCNEGYTINGYRVTGDNYFFLNFYRMKDTNVKIAGSGREMIFPSFFSKQYEYFHYIDICERTKHDVCALKARGVGFSEIAACLGVRPYSTIRGSHSVYEAFEEKKVKDVLSKCWEQLEFLNRDSEGGMKHLRQAKNSDMHRRASLLNKQREEFGFMSDIIGFVVDKPSKLRGDRIDRVFFEEAGSNPILKKSYLQGEALVEILGNKFGTRFVWGTGGDSGPALEGLSDMFYNPKGYNFLPYRHNHTKDGEYALTAFFIPAYTFVSADGFIDNRGVTNIEKAKKFYLDKREGLISDPKAHLIHCAEFCFTPDDALALEGSGRFNTVLLADQVTRIKVHKVMEDGGPIPTIQNGQLDWIFKTGKHTAEDVKGVKFTPKPGGKVHILETPIVGEDGVTTSKNLYIAGIDGIDMGQEDTSESTKDPSDFCVVIKKRAYGLEPPKIVAYYRDRPKTLEEAHRTCLQMLTYYGCQAVLESTRISLLQYFRKMKCENRFLMRRPRATQTDIQNGRSKQFGSPATDKIIEHYLDLISNYIDEFSQEIWFIEVLNEAITYSLENKRKFDIIAAWGMAELGDEELMGIVPKKPEEDNKLLEPIGYWTDERGIKHRGIIPEEYRMGYRKTNDINYIPFQHDSDGARRSNRRFD